MQKLGQNLKILKQLLGFSPIFHGLVAFGNLSGFLPLALGREVLRILDA
jgi:hypothetical protein